MPSRKPYPSDVRDEEWAVVVPYVTLLPLDAGPRDHDLRAGVFEAQVEALAATVQAVTGATVEVAYVDQGYTGAQPAADAQAQGLRLEVVTHAETRRGFVLLPRRWVVERRVAWKTRFPPPGARR